MMEMERKRINRQNSAEKKKRSDIDAKKTRSITIHKELNVKQKDTYTLNQRFHSGAFKAYNSEWDCCNSKIKNISGCCFGPPQHHTGYWENTYGGHYSFEMWSCCNDTTRISKGCSGGCHPEPFPRSFQDLSLMAKIGLS
jgi:hypothetical protein